MAKAESQAAVAPRAIVARPAPRGRPTAKRAAEIDEVIRLAALNVFLASGFEAASMDAITAAAGISKGTLYARYPNKETLFLSVLKGERDRLSSQASAFNHLLPPDLEGRLRHHARTLVKSTQRPEYKRIVQLVDANSATFPELARFWHEAGTQRYLKLLADNMAAAAEPHQRSVDWEFVADLFLHAISGWTRTQLATGRFDEAAAVRFSERTIEVILTWIDSQNSPSHHS